MNGVALLCPEDILEGLPTGDRRGETMVRLLGKLKKHQNLYN